MSDSLRHFPSQDPPALEKTKEREEIQSQVEEYLAKGGKITEIPFDESAEKYWPLKRTRQAQINFIRNRDYKKRQGT